MHNLSVGVLKEAERVLALLSAGLWGLRLAGRACLLEAAVTPSRRVHPQIPPPGHSRDDER